MHFINTNPALLMLTILLLFDLPVFLPKMSPYSRQRLLTALCDDMLLEGF
jgi:hypothetical protein